MTPEVDLSSELAETRRRLAELESTKAEGLRAEKVQSALYRIAELASSAQDMQEFYRAVHAVVGEMMDATNFFIALYDEERQLISWPYYADEIDPDIPDPNQWDAFGEGYARGTTAYVLRTGKPQLLMRQRMLELVELGEIEIIGSFTEESIWLGVPLKAEGHTVGVLVVQSYTKDVQYSEQDKDLLAFVGHHVGAALSRARAIEETRQRNAELALINSVQAALAGELELQAIYDIVGDKIREIFDAQVVQISTLDEATGLQHFPYLLERGERLRSDPVPLGGFSKHVLETREPLMIIENVAAAAERYGSAVVAGEASKSVLFVPLATGGRATGVISLQNVDREHAFTDSDQQLLETLARTLSVALDNARLVHETRQRNAELALINSVQEGLAGELELQAIYDLVGDKVRDVFDAQVVDIAVYDEPAGLLRFPYTIERGVRLPDEPIPLIGFRKHVMETGEPLMINEDTAAAAERYGNPLVRTTEAGERPKSVVFVPLIVGGRATGVISLQNVDREHAFTDADQRLLTTLAGSLSVALENARLVHETRQRNAELALINSVQEALAGELELQAIYDIVGDKIQEIFDAQVVDIGIFDFDAGLTRYPYTIERGVRFPDEPVPITASPTTQELFETKAPVLINDVPTWQLERGVQAKVFQGEPALSVLIAPLTSGDELRGRISLQNLDRTNAFSDSDVRLLTTLAGSLSVALENARLVHETRQRNAELALINSVQAALAGELELQAIYDVVGDRIHEIFDAQVVGISTLDEATRLHHYAYIIERGERLRPDPVPLAGFSKHVLETREPLLINENVAAEAERHGSVVVAGEMARSALYVPLVTGGRATGVISLQNLDREHAFAESDQRLLVTLAGSLSAALENARLMHETRQRNAELALINSVQTAIAGELDPQAIYDVVGDKVREIFDAQAVSMSTFDEATKLLHIPYLIERGERLRPDPLPLGGFRKHVLETREPLMINEDLEDVAERYGSPIVAGAMPKSVLFVPLVSGGRATGVISLQNVDREHAFTDSDQRLLVTLAGSLSVALENARLVDETRQRNAELALINSVQESIAGELDQQAIYELVGDTIQEIFDAQVVLIATLDEAKSLLDFPYMIERGERMQPDAIELRGFSKHVLETREPLMINEDVADAGDRFGSAVVAGEAARSLLFVPLVTGGRATGYISLQNVDREYAFTESDQRLLVTLAGSLSVALENARLVQETRQRVGELATVNSVGQALASQLELDVLIELVGDKLQEVFDADIVYVALHDEAAGRIDFAYYSEDGERQEQPPMEYGQGLTSRILESREPLLLNRSEQWQEIATARVGTPSLSYLGVPIFAGDKAIGVISVQSTRETGRFGESDARLLSTIAANVGSTIQNARLYRETRRRANETAALAEMGREVSAMLDLTAVLGRIGERAQALLEVETSAVYLADEDGNTFRATIALGKNADEILADTIAVGEGIIGNLAARGAAEVINNTGSDPRAITIPGTAQEEDERLMAAPLLVRERVIGMMAVWRYRGSQFTEDDLSFLIGLSQQAAIAIENARLFEAQSEAERQYRELVEELPLAVYRDLPDDSATSEYISPRVEQLFGYPRERWSEPEFFASILHPEDRDETIAKHAAALARSDERWSFEYRLIAPDGRTVFVRDDAWIIKDEDGKPAHVQGFMIDVTDQARAHAEIRRQKQYFESLVDVSPVAIVVMDAGERVTGWNPAAAALFGWSAEEAIGKQIDELVFEEGGARDEGREVTRQAIETGRAQRMGRRTRKDGGVVDVELMLVPLEVDGEHVGFYAIYHDITELQQAREEAEAATQAKSAFLATMSHEIRTPMNAVIGMTGLLLGTQLTAEQREFAEVVRSSGDALLHVIDDILDYSKIEAGKLELESEPVDLRECVEGALEIVAPRAWEKEIELGCLIDEDAPAGIVGDTARLRQVLLNLLSNAVKFTDEGEVVVDVDAERAQANSYRLHLAVRDTGIGIPEDRMARLFTSFSQVDATTTRRYGGTGLGLAISKRLVELMGGTMWVESEEGKGSTFHIELIAKEAKVPARMPEPDGLPQLGGKRILVVDDNATNREIVSRHARSWGMESVAIASPSEALARIAEGETFEVAVLDMMMPELDGLALAREIRRHRDERELPLVLLTSLGRLPQAQSSGEFAVQLTKPVRASQLFNALLKALSEHAHEPEAAGELVGHDGKPATSPLRILLAEDNAVNQKVALRLLDQVGYRADVASNGLEALEALERKPYDVVLMDVQMPELDGLDASRQICERWPVEVRPRIIAMTANALPEDREACFAAGMDDYVAKPIRPDELAAALSRARPREGTGTANAEDSRVGAGLDAGALESLRDLGGDEFVTEVIDTFLTDAPALVASLRTSRERGDTEELRRAAHTLKSNGATLGAESFSELCRELEQRAKNGELDGTAELLDRIEREYGALEEILATVRSAS